jgi:hypothetical protein
VSFEEHLTDEAAGFVAEPHGAGVCALVAFGGIRGGLGVPPYEFFRVTEGLDVRRIFVRDLDQVWYQRGIRGLGESPQTAAEALRAEIGAQPIVTVGNSAGGFGAIWFGAMLGAVEAHAFAPQTAIDRWHRLRWGDLRWMREMAAVRRLDPRSERLDLRRYLLAHPSTLRIHLHVSATHRRDLRHARHLAGLPGVRIDRYPSGGHRLVTDLRDAGDLAVILRSATTVAARADGPA